MMQKIGLMGILTIIGVVIAAIALLWDVNASKKQDAVQQTQVALLQEQVKPTQPSESVATSVEPINQPTSDIPPTLLAAVSTITPSEPTDIADCPQLSSLFLPNELKEDFVRDFTDGFVTGFEPGTIGKWEPI